MSKNTLVDKCQKMFCIIQYFENTQIEENAEKISLPRSQQSVTSLKEENKELLINPNCPTQILIDYIYQKVGIDKNVEFDLCDVDTGELLNIQNLKPFGYATSIMKPRQTYVIALQEKDQYGKVGYDLVLGKQTKLYLDVLIRMKKRTGRRSTGPKEVKRSAQRRVPSGNSIDSVDFDRKTSHSSRNKNI